MATDKHVGFGLLTGSLSGLFLAATDAAGQSGRYENQSEMSHRQPLIAKEPPI